MKTKHHKTILALFVTVFFVVGTYLITVSLGLTVDWKNIRIVKTGSIFLKFSPTDAGVFVNDKVGNVKNGILTSGVLINELAPQNYNIKLKKDGFVTWEKNLSVESGSVTAATNIVLWPDNLEKKSVASTTSAVALSDGGLLVQDEKKGVFFDKTKLKGDGIFLSGKNSDLVVLKENGDYFLTNVRDAVSAMNINELFQSLKRRQLKIPGTSPIKNIFLHPFSPNKIMILTNTSLYSLDSKKLELERLITVTSTNAVAFSNNEVFLTDGKGDLHITNLILNNSSYFPLNIEGISSLISTGGGDKIFISTQKGELLVYDRSAKNLKKIASELDSFAVSPEEKRLLLVDTRGNTRIFFLEDYNIDGLNLKDSSSVIKLAGTGIPKEIAWIPALPNQIVFLSGNRLMASEADPREPASRVIATEVKDYLVDNKKLLVLKENGELLEVDLSL
jgi:hypothetical protein